MANTTKRATQALSIDDIMTRKLAPMVVEGKYENVKIKEIKKYPVTATNKNEFVRITYVTSDGREISENRFAQGLNIMVSHIREQLNQQEEEFDVSKIFDGTTEVTMWVQKKNILNNQGEKMRVTNINFLEPLDWNNEVITAETPEPEPTDVPESDPMPF